MHRLEVKYTRFLSAKIKVSTLITNMSKKFLSVNWKVIAGAAHMRKMLRLRPNADGLYICPVNDCLHVGFQSGRGLRKHINTRHGWFFYFTSQPDINRDIIEQDPDNHNLKQTTNWVPAFSLTEGVGKDFLQWMQSPLGGGKSSREATQVAKRGMKYLLHVMGDSDGSPAQVDYIDACLGSPSTVIKFMETVVGTWGLTNSGSLNYVKAMSDLLDFRKAQGVSDVALRSFAVTEVYLRRGKENLRRRKAMEYSRHLDVESLIARDSWATIEEMQQVIPFHMQKFRHVVDKCDDTNAIVTPVDLAFASRFIATYLFLRVKCSRPMTFQCLTLDMVKKAGSNGGYVDHTEFKTSATYVFDTLILNDEVMGMLNTYITVVRPKQFPKCQYVLITNNGNQYTAFCPAMTLLVNEAIGKYVNPTRYRQIVETESAERLTPEEQRIITHDQKHSSKVAERCYQKRLSRDVAEKGKKCMAKLIGSHSVELSNISDGIENNNDSFDMNVLKKSMELVGGVEAIEGAGMSTGTESPIDLDIARKQNTETQSMDASSPIPDDGDESAWQPEPSVAEPGVSMVPSTRNVSNVLAIQTNTHSLPIWTATSAVTTHTPFENVSNAVTRMRHRPSSPLSTEEDKTGNMIIRVKKEKSVNKKGNTKFSAAEDKFLIDGLKKYGKGKWSQMLNDPNLRFQEGRSRDTLRMRAASAEFQRMKEEEPL